MPDYETVSHQTAPTVLTEAQKSERDRKAQDKDVHYYTLLPAEDVPKRGRLLADGTYHDLVDQLQPGEMIVRYSKRRGLFCAVVILHPRNITFQLALDSDGQKCLGYYALPKTDPLFYTMPKADYEKEN